VTGDLKDELSVPPLIKELILRQSTDREAAQHERTRTETQDLARVLAAVPNKLNPLCPLELLSRNDQIRKLFAEDTAGALQFACRTLV
jgi:hypothetical protein